MTPTNVLVDVHTQWRVVKPGEMQSVKVTLKKLGRPLAGRRVVFTTPTGQEVITSVSDVDGVATVTWQQTGSGRLTLSRLERESDNGSETFRSS